MKEFKKYLITLVIGLLIALLVIIFRDTFNLIDKKEIIRNVADGFSISGICVGGFGALVFVSNEGAFDMVTFGLLSFFTLFKAKGTRKYDSYYDYKQSKAKNKLKSGFILYVGLFLILISIILIMVYHKL